METMDYFIKTGQSKTFRDSIVFLALMSEDTKF